MLKFRVVGAMSLGLKVDTCISKLPNTLCLKLYLVLFLRVFYSLFKISEDPFGGGETRKVSLEVFIFFSLIVGLCQYMIYNVVRSGCMAR